MNDESIQIVNTVERKDIPFFLSEQWSKEAMNNIKLVKEDVLCKKGVNTLRFYGMSPAIVLERIVLYNKEIKLPESYLGPKESYIKREEVSWE